MQTTGPPHPGPLILASASPRRAALLHEYGYVFDVIEPPLEEPHSINRLLSPAQQAEALSYFKASCVAGPLERGLVLAGDTVAAIGQDLFGKPADREDARRILRRLAGTTHHVITGVTLLDAATSERRIEHATTAITMKPLSPEEVESYLATGAWMGKAGAYGIQDHGDAFVTKWEGSFSNVVGMPMELVTEMLQSWHIPSHSHSTIEKGTTTEADPEANHAD